MKYYNLKLMFILSHCFIKIMLKKESRVAH